ncbi:MAG: macro domain-containing protein [bacterium]|nr:macro domain-containing protein [bacterium]
MLEKKETAIFEIVSGDFFSYKVDIMVNSVNTVGVMGKGIAKEFKNKFPKMFEDYKKACYKNDIHIKALIESEFISYNKELIFHKFQVKKILSYSPHIYKEKDFLILNLPTKIDWRYPSDYEIIKTALNWIKNNLDYLSNVLNKPVKKIILPLLGAGAGKLDPIKIEELIKEILKDTNLYVLIYKPKKIKQN